VIPSEAVARSIKRIRQQRGWSAQELADRCAATGTPKLTASVIANIETGRPKDGERTRLLTVDELLAFALALDVPPVILLFPDLDLEHPDPLDVTPGVSVADPMRVATWMSGATSASGLPTAGYTRAAAPVRGYFAAHDAIEAAKSADVAARQGRGSDEQRGAALERLALRLEPIFRRGTLPANLPLSWIDEMVSRGWLAADAVPTDAVAEAERRLNEWEEDG
jgi:transcriptional regulator with XRE-family HTH domain